MTGNELPEKGEDAAGEAKGEDRESGGGMREIVLLLRDSTGVELVCRICVTVSTLG